ncbi:MAG: class I SAM-dependent methyltransferase [Candidatus Aenigmatarchaeota archaeon]
MSRSKKKVSDRYDVWTPFYDAVDNFPLISRSQKIWKKNAVDLLDPSDGERVLDIGTGTGQVLIWIADRMKKGVVIGSDISESMVKKARKKMDRNEKTPDDLTLKVIKDDIESSKFPDNYFDKMIATFTFTTIPDMEKAASECARMLKPDGKMIILDTGRPKKRYGYLLFYPMMLSAKVFGRTHMDRDVKGVVSKKFEIYEVEENMVGMVYTLECRRRKTKNK